MFTVKGGVGRKKVDVFKKKKKIFILMPAGPRADLSLAWAPGAEGGDTSPS